MRRGEGVTLVEAALLVSLLGVVLAASVPTFVRSLRTSKTDEPPREMERIFRAAAAYYATPQPTAAGKRLGCMPDAAGPTPPKPTQEPAQVAFGAADAPATWRALGYEPSEPIRYRYSFLPARSGCGLLPADSHGETMLTLRAEGDLDNDGRMSLYERTAVTKDGELRLDPLLSVRDRMSQVSRPRVATRSSRWPPQHVEQSSPGPTLPRVAALLALASSTRTCRAKLAGAHSPAGRCAPRAGLLNTYLSSKARRGPLSRGSLRSSRWPPQHVPVEAKARRGPLSRGSLRSSRWPPQHVPVEQSSPGPTLPRVAALLALASSTRTCRAKLAGAHSPAGRCAPRAGLLNTYLSSKARRGLVRERQDLG